MRTLKFIVDGQVIKPDPSCNFDGLIPGSEGYLQAEFTLSDEWQGFAVVASFWSMMGVEYPPAIVKKDRTCTIPVEALKRRRFKIKLIGQSKSGERLQTNKLVIYQNGGEL